MNPTVSVIISTHNRAAMLRRAVNSVLAQSYQDLDLIVVSDGSTDDTDEVISPYSDSRIKFLRHEASIGASAARNTGIKASTGELIAFLDDDDEWLPEKLEKQVHLIQKLPKKVGMVYCWMDYFDQDGKLIKKHHPELKGYVFPHVLDAQRLGGCPTLIVRREVIDKVGGFDESLPRGNDGDFIRRVCRVYEVDFVPEVLVKVYMGHGDRISQENEKGLRNAIHGKQARLRKFQNDLKRYPKQHIKILSDLGHLYSRAGDLNNSFKHYLMAFKINPLNHYLYRKILSSIIHKII